MRQEKVVMYDSDEAATQQTVTGWVDRGGRFWASDEHMARYCGSTHTVCKNNPEHPVHRTNAWCDVCRDESRAAKYASMPQKAWAGEPLVLFDVDTYFFDEESLRDYLLDPDIDLADVKLCICEPNYPRELDPSDVFCDDLPEDGEINDDQLQAAFDLLNEMIRKAGPLSWSEGGYRAALPLEFIDAVLAEREAA